MPDAKLTDEAKTYIVQALACFDTPSQVAESVNKEFGLSITRMHVAKYDPTKVSGRGVSTKWRTVFDAARKSFIEDSSQIAIAHRSTRLRALHRMSVAAEAKGNYPLAAQLHRQAAEEMGNAFTNRREITGKDGKDLPAPPPAVAIFALPDNGRGS